VLKERENTLRQHFEELPLNTNYRSVKEIIAFNNALFDSIEKALPLPQQKIYLKHKQETQENTGKGKVEVITYAIEKNKQINWRKSRSMSWILFDRSRLLLNPTGDCNFMPDQRRCQCIRTFSDQK
jgi:ATP-dependent exoDNAse (exonuclease V) beta subunit